MDIACSVQPVLEDRPCALSEQLCCEEFQSDVWTCVFVSLQYVPMRTAGSYDNSVLNT